MSNLEKLAAIKSLQKILRNTTDAKERKKLIEAIQSLAQS